jgi:hypothetical protein
MSRRVWIVAGVIAIAAVVMALVLWPSSHPELDPDQADRIVLYSLDPRGPGEDRPPVTGEPLHGHQVLGLVEITDLDRRRELIEALRDGISRGDASAACFWPRHVLRIEQDGRTIDYVICFQCHNYQKWVDGRHVTSSTISGDIAPIFNKPLEGANVPIFSKWP